MRLSTWWRAGLAGLVGASVLALGLEAGSAQAAGPGTVTFPDVTAPFNPDRTPYVVDVALHAGVLYAQWNEGDPNSWTELPLSGQATIVFPVGSEASGWVKIWSCLDSTRTDCSTTGDQSPTWITVDRAAQLTSFTGTDRSVYPVRDRYRDRVGYRARSDERGQLLVEVFDASGRRTWSSSPVDAWSPYPVWFDGFSRSGAMLPEGRYTVRGRFTDVAGNTVAATKPLTVSAKRLVVKTFRRTWRPSAILSRKTVGACSTLASPSSRGWSGSLGYYSDKRCARTGAPAWVETDHFVYVPRALDEQYGSFQVSVYGGAAAKRPDSGAGISYYHPTGDTWSSAYPLGSRLGTHLGEKTDGAAGVGHGVQTGKPYVYFAIFTAGGYWYDVKTVTVQLRYKTLV